MAGATPGSHSTTDVLSALPISSQSATSISVYGPIRSSETNSLTNDMVLQYFATLFDNYRGP